MSSTQTPDPDDESAAPSLEPDSSGAQQQQQITLTNVEAGGDIFVSAIQVTAETGPPDAREAAEALIQGPLKVAQAEERAKAASELSEAGRHVEAAAEFLSVADQLERFQYGLVAEFYIEAAAQQLASAGETKRATELLETIVRNRIDRYDIRAQNDAFRLTRSIETERQWVAEGLAARAVWPEQPVAAIGALEVAWTQARDSEDEGEWAAALIEVLVNLAKNDRAIEVAQDVRARIPVAMDGPQARHRLAIEFDYLDALTLTDPGSSEIENAWNKVLTMVASTTPLEPSDAAWIWQRRAASLIQSDRVDDGRAALLHAIRAWSSQDGNEDQIREAFYSRERAASLSGALPRDTVHLYSYFYALRGARNTPATQAERLEFSGLHARLEGKWPDALRAYGLAYAIHRAAGNFYGRLDAANLLGELYVAAGRPADALRFWVECGQEKRAVELARTLPTEICLAALMLCGAIWQRAVSFAVIGAVGRRMSEGDVSAVAEVIMEAARPNQRRLLGPDPVIKAREALAAVLVDLPDRFLDEARRLVADMLNSPFLDRKSAAALVRLTESGRSDETELLATAFIERQMNARGMLSLWLGQQLSHYPDLALRIRDAALGGDGDALEVLAMSDAVTADAELAGVADARIDGFLSATEQSEGSGGERVTRMADLTGLGLVGRLCSDSRRSALMERLLSVAENNDELQMTRISATDALFNLATVAPKADAQGAVERLIALAKGEYTLSELEQSAGDPFTRFKVTFDTASSLQTSALSAAAALTAAASLDVEPLLPTLHASIRSSDMREVTAGLEAFSRLRNVELPIDFDQASASSTAAVRLAAYRALNARDLLTEVQLLRLASDTETDIRGFALNVAKEKHFAEREVAQQLSTDRDAYLRRRAQLHLASLG